MICALRSLTPASWRMRCCQASSICPHITPATRVWSAPLWRIRVSSASLPPAASSIVRPTGRIAMSSSSPPQSPSQQPQHRSKGAKARADSDANIHNFAPVARIMKTALPENAKIAKEAKECMQECVSEFISFITSEGTSPVICRSCARGACTNIVNSI